MSKDEKKQEKPDEKDRFKKIRELLVTRRNSVEEEYLKSLEDSHGSVTSGSISLLDVVQEIDEHIAEMDKRLK